VASTALCRSKTLPAVGDRTVFGRYDHGRDMRHALRMGVLLHAVEALPGAGRYVATFHRVDGTDQTAVVQVAEGTITAAEASLPEGWGVGSAEHAALADVVLALHHARELAPPAAALSDVPGGWDVSLGNVVLAGGVPTCTADGAMEAGADGRYQCPVCGAAALFAE
jgi:hypothetical protein